MPRILYVEDHADTRHAISGLLRHRGYEVESVDNARDALASAIACAPDVLLLDLALPEMDGVQLIEVLRSYLRLARIPVVVLSAYQEGRLIEAAKALNVSSVLVKGNASIDLIRAAIRRALAEPLIGNIFRPESRGHGDGPRQ